MELNKLKKCFIIAEISANHGQNYKKAVSMIKKAAECGADAVKFQTYTPDTLTIDCDRKEFIVKHPEWGGQSLYDLYKGAYTPWDWFPKLKKIADREGLVFFSTAFDKTAVDLLEEIQVPVHKVASFELVDIPLIEYMAGTKKPMIMSTGMATLDEIKEAVRAARGAGAKDVALLKCVSGYPAKPKEMNLKTISSMEKKFRLPIGLSDHTMGIGVSIAAVTLGAKVIEKHFTLSRKAKTADSFFSLEPAEFKDLVSNIRVVEEAIGTEFYGLTPDQKKTKRFRRSLYVVKDIKKGEKATEDNVRSIRPALGLEPKYLKHIIGKKANKQIKKGTPVKPEYFKKG